MPTKTKKEVEQKIPAKKIAKKEMITGKKLAAKKVPVKKAVSKKHSPSAHQQVMDEKPQVKTIEKIIHRFEKRFVFVPLCDNCEYIPMRINRLVALMTVLVIVLSGIVIAQSQPLEVNQVIANAMSVIAQK